MFEPVRAVGTGDELQRRACLVNGDDDAPAAISDRPSTLHHLTEHGIEAGVDPEYGRIQRGFAFVGRLEFAGHYVGTFDRSSSPFRLNPKQGRDRAV